MYKRIWLLAVTFILLSSCEKKEEKRVLETKGEPKMEIKVKSSAFEHGGMIPSKYTCDGDDISPPLSWEGVPEGTKSIALISDDPDAPMGTWVHWVLFNLPPDTSELPEDVAKKEELENGAKQGRNDFPKIGYGGPCPPSGTHRYYFKIYALDTMLDLSPGATKKDLLKAMEGHILAEGQLMGKYKRQ
ncbi:MAG: YbhB/YbcL family Raf kinase inhibitor-like protein [Candidatus Mariimomonas ferrooxydans]